MYYQSDEYVTIDNLCNVNDGFKKGNIFKNLYLPYKKYTYNFTANGDRQKMLLDIMKYSFYAHELNLYLDNYPNDRSKINLFNEYSNKTNELIEMYSKMYEPLVLSNMTEVPFEWEESPWPWEGV